MQTRTFKPEGVDPTKVMTIEGATGTFEQFRQGVETPDGKRLIWVGNRRTGVIQEQVQKVRADTNFTLDNYQTVRRQSLRDQDSRGDDRDRSGREHEQLVLLNSIAVRSNSPSDLIPIMIAAFAAYGFAWMRFPGRKLLFVVVVAMPVVPLQIAVVPVLRVYVALDLNGTYLAVWLAHTGFGLVLLQRIRCSTT